MDKIEKKLRGLGEIYAATREESEGARTNAMKGAVEAADAGKPQQLIAELLGVDRMTVRKWVGKR